MKKNALKLSALLFSVLLALPLLAGCSTGSPEETNEKLPVVVTIYPIYDWVREIAGDRVSLTVLLDSGVDLHSYQPTAADIVTITTSDLFIYVGGNSDGWVDDVMKNSGSEKTDSLDLIKTLGDLAKEEKVVEGMEAEEEDEEEGGIEYDEHVWLSLKNAAVLCRAIADGLSKVDPDGKDVYGKNADSYIEKLNALDKEYEKAVEGAARKTVLFGDRFPFMYLCDDYGIDYYAAFVGCSAESEASFKTIAFLASKVDDLSLPAILQIETADGSLASAVREATAAKDQKILTLDSMQSAVPGADKTYLEVMTKNLEILKEALN